MVRDLSLCDPTTSQVRFSRVTTRFSRGDMTPQRTIRQAGRRGHRAGNVFFLERALQVAVLLIPEGPPPSQDCAWQVLVPGHVSSRQTTDRSTTPLPPVVPNR
jgi:hypothetical protein